MSATYTGPRMIYNTRRWQARSPCLEHSDIAFRFHTLNHKWTVLTVILDPALIKISHQASTVISDPAQSIIFGKAFSVFHIVQAT